MYQLNEDAVARCLSEFDFESAARILRMLEKPIRERDGSRVYWTAEQLRETAEKLLRDVVARTEQDCVPCSMGTCYLSVDVRFCDDEGESKNSSFIFELSLTEPSAGGVGITRTAFANKA